MNLQDMLDEYINFKIQEVLEVALSNKKKTITKELESIREWFSDFENQLDEVRALADENEYNLERHAERIDDFEGEAVHWNEGVIDSRIKNHLNKLKIITE